MIKKKVELLPTRLRKISETELHQILLKYETQQCQNENGLSNVTHPEKVAPQQSTHGFKRNLEHGYYILI